MKTTHVCPKCKGTKLLHVRQVADRIGEAYRHHLDETPSGRADNDEPSDAWRLARLEGPARRGRVEMINVGRVEAWVCRACGFTEFYTMDLAEIRVDGRNVIAVDGPPAGPYR